MFIQHISNCIVSPTNNNQRLGSTFDDLDARLSLLCQVGDDVICPCKIHGGMRVPISVHSLDQCCPIQSQLQSLLGVCSYYVNMLSFMEKVGQDVKKMGQVLFRGGQFAHENP